MVQIEALTGDLSAAVSLLNDALGAGSYSVVSLEKLCADPNHRVLAARQNGRLVGIASARLIEREGLAFYAHFGEGARVLEGRTVGSLHASAVLPDTRGQGVGSALAQARLAWLCERGCDYAVGISWLSGLAHTSKPVFERLGFRALGTSQELFRELSTAQGWGCPVCGHPCHCASVLYGRPIP